ncbi:actin-binding Rho-activating protein-like isoform X1 [Tribolium madens]|uniref:actin-binding Rho-activating protein-like isoform X1 n=1 Tax=Tribolium madens TaxID=41895 RepID=UPI001CF74305|nr:actin-binding Rho-activating protein-like isoform X1 [Tribolium madens]
MYPQIERISKLDSPLSSKVALFNAVANKHIQSQAVNPFSNDCKAGGLPRPKISKEEYGRPARGSLSEARGFKATAQVCREILELCEIIHEQGEPLFTPEEKPDDPRIVISFGELFSLYTVISNNLVGILLRARKHKLVDFEGEVLFQRRDDHVPIILLKPIAEIRKIFRAKIDEAVKAQKISEEEHNSDSN